jgi:hypothetical protein
MRAKDAQKRPVWAVVAAAVLCLALVSVGLRWPNLLTQTQLPAEFPLQAAQGTAHTLHPLLELLKLVTAAVIGIIITAVHRRCQRDKPLGRSMEHAQILLCVAGALVIIIIGNSIARAFGIAGAASLIRFRTPVKNPKDITILFLMLGLGMCCGMGIFAVAGLGTIFVAVFLLVLDLVGEPKRRAMILELVAEGQEFPSAHVQNVLSQYRVTYEPREFLQGTDATMKYHAKLAPDTSLEELALKLVAGGAAGIKSVAWKKAKKKKEE